MVAVKVDIGYSGENGHLEKGGTLRRLFRGIPLDRYL
jgi:hypothetical protein